MSEGQQYTTAEEKIACYGEPSIKQCPNLRLKIGLVLWGRLPYYKAERLSHFSIFLSFQRLSLDSRSFNVSVFDKRIYEVSISQLVGCMPAGSRLTRESGSELLPIP
jgi:hypothetical protein